MYELISSLESAKFTSEAISLAVLKDTQTKTISASFQFSVCFMLFEWLFSEGTWTLLNWEDGYRRGYLERIAQFTDWIDYTEWCRIFNVVTRMGSQVFNTPISLKTERTWNNSKCVPVLKMTARWKSFTRKMCKHKAVPSWDYVNLHLHKSDCIDYSKPENRL